jgi:glycine/D-amino acid oxidase-like deaminating enzyme
VRVSSRHGPPERQTTRDHRLGGARKLSDLKPVSTIFIQSGNRIIFGGAALLRYGGRLAGILTGHASHDKKSLFETFPQLEVCKSHGWGGALGMSYDFLPSIGVLGENRNVFYAVAYSGEGTILTQVAGKIIAHLYRGEENRLTRLFLVNKPIPRVPPEPLRYLGIHAYMLYYRRLGRRPNR